MTRSRFLMRWFVFLLSLSPIFAHSQEIPRDQAIKLLDQINSKYLRLNELGFLGATCEVKYDASTLPKVLITQEMLAGGDPLSVLKISAKDTWRGEVTVNADFLPGTTESQKLIYNPVATFAKDIQQGFLMTWGTKTIQGPLLTKDYLKKVEKTANDYRFFYVNGPSEVIFIFTPDFLLTEIDSNLTDQTIIEKPAFSRLGGLYYLVELTAHYQYEKQPTDVHYKVDYLDVDSIPYPSKVRVSVNNNIDVGFSFVNCKMEKGKVINLDIGPAKK